MASQYPGWLAGQRVTAQRISDSLPQFVWCTTNLDRASTTTYADDPVLQFTLAANAIYIVEFTLFMGSLTAAAGGKTVWRVPASADGLRGVTGPGSSAIAENNITMRTGAHQFSTTTVNYGHRNSLTDLQHIHESGSIFTTTAGTMALQWAQNTSSASATRRGKGSWGRCTRVG